MRRSLVISLVAAVVAALCVGLTTASAAPSAGSDPDRLDAYTAVVAGRRAIRRSPSRAST